MRRYETVCCTVATLVALALVAFMPRTQAADNDPGTTTIQSGVAEHYRQDKQVAVFRDDIAAVDSSGVADVLANVELFRCNGRQNIPVSARFVLAGGSCTVRAYYYYSSAGSYYFLGHSGDVVLTASTSPPTQDAALQHIAPTYVFDGAGATHVAIVVVAVPASDTFDLWVGSY